MRKTSCSSKPACRSTSVSGLAFASILGLGSFAAAAEEPPADAKPAEAKPAEAPAPAAPEVAPDERSPDGGAAELAKAMEALLGKVYDRSAELAFQSMAKTKPSSEKYESAEYVLAESLENLGLSQAAAEYHFAVAEQRQNPALLPRALAGIERLSRAGLIDEERLLKGVLIEADLANVPPDLAEFLSFYRGLSNLRAGYRRWAKSDFAKIESGGYYWARAQIVEAVDLVDREKPADALKLVDALLGIGLDEDERRRAKGLVKEPELIDQLRLVRARLLYENERYDEAIDAYKALRGTIDTPEGEMLLERAWAHFRKGAHHDAMGLLYALRAPSNRALFLPEQYVLQGLIYQRFCHFLAAKGAVRAFRERYRAAIDALEAGTPPHEIEDVAQVADRRRTVIGATHVLEAVRAEKERLDGVAGSLAESGLGPHLERLYGLLEARSTRVHRQMRELGARQVAEQLLEALEQTNLLEYEVGVSILKPLDLDPGAVRLREKAEVVPKGGPKIYYPFEDEFWTDELPDMRFLIQDRCVE